MENYCIAWYTRFRTLAVCLPFPVSLLQLAFDLLSLSDVAGLTCNLAPLTCWSEVVWVDSIDELSLEMGQCGSTVDIAEQTCCGGSQGERRSFLHPCMQRLCSEPFLDER